MAVDISTEMPDEADIDLKTPLEGFLEAVSGGSLLLIKGQFKAEAVVECARCLREMTISISFEVDEQFPVEGVASSLSHQDFARVVPDEPYPLFEGNNLMVEALLRQNLLLSYPAQPFCNRPDCEKFLVVQDTQPDFGFGKIKSVLDQAGDN
jgi:uncharacterized protein